MWKFKNVSHPHALFAIVPHDHTTYLGLHFFLSQFDQRHPREVHGFCSFRTQYKKLLVCQSLLLPLKTNQTVLAFIIQVLLAGPRGAHHISSHLINVPRGLLENSQLLTSAISLDLKGTDSVKIGESRFRNNIWVFEFSKKRYLLCLYSSDL